MKRAFTLIELLVVIAIIGLLSSVILASLSAARAKADDARRLSDLQEIQKSLELYANDNHGNYPTTSGSWLGNCASFGSRPNTGSTGWIPSLAPTYIPVLPSDPKPVSGSTCYLYRSDGTNYFLMAYKTVETYTSATNKWPRPSAPSENDFAFYTSGASGW